MLRIIKPYINRTTSVMRNGLSSVVQKNKVYDISLSQGLFSMVGNIEIKTEHKLQLYAHIVKKQPSTKMFELGNMCPTHALPMGEDMVTLYNQCIAHNEENNINDVDIYVNSTTKDHVKRALDNNMKNINFLLSTSVSFQTINYYTDIEDVENTIEWTNKLDTPIKNGRIHVDCLTECPMEGPIDMKHIIETLGGYIIDFPQYIISLENSRQQITPRGFHYIIAKLCNYVGHDITDRLAIQFSVPFRNTKIQKETKSFMEAYPNIQVHVSAINSRYNMSLPKNESYHSILTYQTLTDL